jgi:hypothetical protein
MYGNGVLISKFLPKGAQPRPADHFIGSGGEALVDRLRSFDYRIRSLLHVRRYVQAQSLCGRHVHDEIKLHDLLHWQFCRSRSPENSSHVNARPA